MHETCWDCGAPLTEEEKEYYGNRCDPCECFAALAYYDDESTAEGKGMKALSERSLAKILTGLAREGETPSVQFKDGVWSAQINESQGAHSGESPKEALVKALEARDA